MDNNSHNKIKAYLEGSLPEDQREEIKDLIGENCDDVHVTALLRGHWDSISENENQNESRVAFEKFGREVGGFSSVRKSKYHTFIRYTRSAAAIMALPLLVMSVYLATRAWQPEPHYVEYAVKPGRTDSLRLPDNTMVWLNSGSRIVYPREFGRKTRKVFISGEAFLNVAKESKRQFIVSAGDVDVRVLGTQFNITSYEDMQSVTVSLIEGSVEIEVQRDNILHSTILTPGDVVRYDKLTGGLERDQFSTDAYCSWREGGFYFRDQTLLEIVTQFERVFNVKIFIHDPRLRQTRYSLAFINGESLEKMLKAINFNDNMYITRDKDMILITSKY